MRHENILGDHKCHNGIDMFERMNKIAVVKVAEVQFSRYTTVDSSCDDGVPRNVSRKVASVLEVQDSRSDTRNSDSWSLSLRMRLLCGHSFRHNR